jgi:pSer/pThr/pTyr-binding forkhead associated (FHA) protein
MRTLSIGRGEGCDIFIDDYRISRRHALLKIYPFGKMEIVDLEIW